MTAKRKRTPVDPIQARLSILRRDFDKLQQDLRGLADDAADTTNATYKVTMKAAEGVAERAFALAEDAAERLGKSVTQVVDDVEDWSAENVDSFRDTVRAQPLQSMVMTLGLGMLLGVLFLRR